MKKDYVYLLIILALMLVGLAISCPNHICTDPAHIECDGGCSCDGMGCTG